jgi:type III secretion system FlhB-like substrate exporter
VAKGYDDMAQRVKELAREHDIVQVENVTLARTLAKEVDIGKAIPTKWHIAVAEVLTMVYKLEKKVGYEGGRRGGEKARLPRRMPRKESDRPHPGTFNSGSILKSRCFRM